MDNKLDYLFLITQALVYAIQIAGLLSNIMRGAYSVTISGSLFNNSLFSILECVRDIPEVRDALYSLSSIDLSTEPGTCVQS